MEKSGVCGSGEGNGVTGNKKGLKAQARVGIKGGVEH